ncbi:KpsF/GutQ family sugar-phosphate isomerase, partial [Candidatus Desantisbacteria bacterium]|nr:KpsF/GutQ family sugar-phosphate isomerase [Candidatus Desantisbacteria bacterium]
MKNEKAILQKAKTAIMEEAQAVINLADNLGESFIHAIEVICNCKGRVIITGMGKSGIVGKKIAATMTSTGTPAYFLHPAEGIHGDLGMVMPEDVVIFISKSGDTQEINNLIPTMKLMGVKLIGITSNPDSILAKHSDVVLDIGVKKEACPLGLAPTTTTTVTLVLGDAIALTLLDKKNFKSSDFALFHPGGLLGKKLLLKVSDIMHKEKSIPVVKKTSLFKEFLFEMTSKRLGMTCVVDSRGILSGIITDGDLRRILEKRENIYKLKAEEIMSKNPKLIGKDNLAVEALKKMEEHQITSL